MDALHRLEAALLESERLGEAQIELLITTPGAEGPPPTAAPGRETVITFDFTGPP